VSKTNRSTARTLQGAEISELPAAGRGPHSRAPGFSDRLSKFNHNINGSPVKRDKQQINAGPQSQGCASAVFQSTLPPFHVTVFQE
jgi:hypothetical protein